MFLLWGFPLTITDMTDMAGISEKNGNSHEKIHEQIHESAGNPLEGMRHYPKKSHEETHESE